MNILNLLTTSKKSTGSKTVEKTISGFEEIIDDLSEALSETNEEHEEAANLVLVALRERDRIEKVLSKGENFLRGLRTLLQG